MSCAFFKYVMFYVINVVLCYVFMFFEMAISLCIMYYFLKRFCNLITINPATTLHAMPNKWISKTSIIPPPFSQCRSRKHFRYGGDLCIMNLLYANTSFLCLSREFKTFITTTSIIYQFLYQLSNSGWK